jgi:GAF domain-containing protein/anti-anti-sigma regulatory factor
MREAMNVSSEVLVRLGGVTTAGLDLKGLLPGVVGVLQEALGEVRVTIYLPDRQGGQLTARGGDESHKVSAGEGEVGRAWQTGTLQRVAADRGVAVPLSAGGRVLGVMEIRLARGERVKEDVLLLARAAAAQVSLAIENAQLREEQAGLLAENERLYHDGLQLVGELSTLNEVIQSLNTTLDLEELLTVIHRQAARVIDATNFYIALLDQACQQVAFPFCVDQGRRVEVSPRSLARGEGRTEWILRAGEPLLWHPRSRHSFAGGEFDVSPGAPRCYLGVPLVVGEWVFGVMAVQSYERGDAFTKEDLRLMVTIAAQAGVAISNARLFEETQAALSKLQEAYKTQEALAATVRELSAPVIQIWEDVLAMPLVGAIDSARAQRITDSLLEGINRHHAKAIIMDVTGVPMVDTQTACHLLQTIRAARLLGAYCVLTGIGADVAQTMVQAGVQLTGVKTLTNLQAGIRYVMDEGWRVAGRPRKVAQSTWVNRKR